jgi:hypothetical protein
MTLPSGGSYSAIFDAGVAAIAAGSCACTPFDQADIAINNDNESVDGMLLLCFDELLLALLLHRTELEWSDADIDVDVLLLDAMLL